MNSNKDIAVKFAKENRFDTAIRSRKKWNGEILYVAGFYGSTPHYTGYPKYIIIENKKPRFASTDEIYNIMDKSFAPIGFAERLEDYL